MEFSALGYSGTNSGGSIVIENSQFDNNKDGVDTNTQIDGDAPAPQNGACPGNGTSPITHTHSCWVFIHNSVHDNNNPNVPQAGSASAGPTGTGMTISGGTNDTVMDNTFSDNGAWGILFVPYPDSNPPVLGQTCTGTGGAELSGFGCVFDPKGNALLGNTFTHDAYFGNQSNADFGQIVINGNGSRNCFAGNTAPAGSAPAGLEQSQPTCDGSRAVSNAGGALLGQVLCDTGFGACPPGSSYPQLTVITMHPLPANLPTMPDPCQRGARQRVVPGRSAASEPGERFPGSDHRPIGGPHLERQPVEHVIGGPEIPGPRGPDQGARRLVHFDHQVRGRECVALESDGRGPRQHEAGGGPDDGFDVIHPRPPGLPMARTQLPVDFHTADIHGERSVHTSGRSGGARS